MAEYSNTSSAKTNTFHKGMVKDNIDLFNGDGIYSHAINAINRTHNGDLGGIGNEPSNKYCNSASYDIIGYAHIHKSKWIIFSTDDTNSEIGIFDESNYSYTILVNDICLNFKKQYLITAVVKENYDCTYSAYWQDNNNPDRVMNIDRIPWKKELVKTDSNCEEDCCYEEIDIVPLELDCDVIRLQSLKEEPCIKINKSQTSGQLINGSYMACIAYSENGIKITDYSIPSTPLAIWDHTGIGGGIEVNIENLDERFNEYELVIVSIVSQQTIAKKIGYYSIRQTKVIIDIINQSLATIDLATIPLKSAIYEKSEKMYGVNGYLLRLAPTTNEYFNYQPLANKIETKWVQITYPSNYYYDGGNKTGYMRDEVYPYFIRWVYATGARSNSFHIPGREATTSDLTPISGQDIINVIDSEYETKKWQVYDTSEITNNLNIALDDGIITKKGLMSYWQSEEKYPDDKPEIWGDLCGQYIRHHKMPSDKTIPIYQDNGKSINILGVDFSKIEHPVDANGDKIENIVGYEILRGSREGNKSIIAKGVFNNMWDFPIKTQNKTGGSIIETKGLQQNYPYNDNNPDPFLTWNFDTLDPNKQDWTGAYNNRFKEEDKLGSNTDYGPKGDYFSFHSPETAFAKPYLGSNVHLCIYNQIKGYSVGNFEIPHKHPKFKFITDAAFYSAAILGTGIGLLAAMGNITTSSESEVNLYVASTSARVTRNPNSVLALIGDVPLLAASVGTVPGTVASVISFFANFLYFAGQGIQQTLDIIRGFIKYRDYALQYNSHCFYNSFSSGNKYARRAIEKSGAKYIGSGIQDFDNTYRINNLNRNKYVALKLKYYGETELDKRRNILPINLGDNTRQSLTDIDGDIGADKIHKKPYDYGNLVTLSYTYYGALKINNRSQYGQLNSIVQLPVSCVNYVTIAEKVTYTTPYLFGGDIYINRYTEKNPYMFFNTWLFDVLDGTEFNYTNYINGPIPRYYANFNEFDVEDFDIDIRTKEVDLVVATVTLPDVTASDTEPNFINLKTPSDLHRLDRKEGAKSFAVKDAWFYLFYNGVRDFFCESEFNLAYRDYGENPYEKFYDPYGLSFSDLSTMFRSDLIKKEIFYKYDLSLSVSKLFNNFASWATLLPRDYNPSLYNSCFEYYPKRVIYSLQQQEGMKRDNWLNFLPLNYKDFEGKISVIKSLNGTGAIILFEDFEPKMFTGIDQLQTTGGTKITIGDGGLFQQNMQGVVNADDVLFYGTCQSSRSAVNTPHGLLFVSQKTGQVFLYTTSLQDISKLGLEYWLNENLPSKLLEKYPEYPLYDNPVKAIGVQAIYDNTFDLFYITKKDYKPLIDNMIYDENGNFYRIGDTTYSDATLGDIDIQRCPFSVYGSRGTKVYNEDYTSSEIINDNPFWKRMGFENFSTFSPCDKQDFDTYDEIAYNSTLEEYESNGPVNRIAYWGIEKKVDGTLKQHVLPCGTMTTNNYTMQVNNQSVPPLNEWKGFQVCVEIEETKTYYLAIAGDNYYRFSVDDITIIEKTQELTDNFLYLHIYPIILEAGTRVIKVEGLNTGQYAGFGAEIYDITPSEGQTVKEYLEGLGRFYGEDPTDFDSTETIYSQLNVVWTVRDEFSFTSGEWKCLEGCELITEDLDPCETPKCKCVHILPCTFDNPKCFKEANWTLSFDPLNKSWLSFHDWHPDLLMPSYKHFYSIKKEGIWKHNEEWQSYNNYYSKDYGWEIDFPVVTPNNITTLRCIEYYLDVLKYYNNGRDYNHLLDDNFDRAIVYNSEQISGVLRMAIKGKNAPLDLIEYPKASYDSINILYSKEENKYRFNQFWDVTKDRGEFTDNTIPMWVTEENGYKRNINLLYTDNLKLQRKKFRHYGNHITLRKMPIVLPQPEITYGALYNWYAATNAAKITSSDTWSVPTDEQFDTLIAYLGGNSVAGGKLKSTRTEPISDPRWDSPNIGATNEVGFIALPGGFRSINGIFGFIGFTGGWWSFVEKSMEEAYFRSITANYSDVFKSHLNKANGLLVRLVRTATTEEQALDDGTNLTPYVGNDGKSYKTVKIGTQVWTAENLAETKYRNKSIIPNIIDNTEWKNDRTGAMCYYDNDINNAIKYNEQEIQDLRNKKMILKLNNTKQLNSSR